MKENKKQIELIDSLMKYIIFLTIQNHFIYINFNHFNLSAMIS